MSKTIVKECTCDNAYQDKVYGKGKRVMNETMRKAASGFLFRCTVCLKEK